MTTKHLLIAAMVVLPGTRLAMAASPADIASGLAPEVVQVVSGGAWQDAGKTGGYRAVLVVPVGGGGAQLFIEWLAAGTGGAAPAIAAISPVKEIGELKLPDATLGSETEKTGEYTIFVEPNDPAKDSGQSYTIVASAPGKYTFSLGAPPE